jgi:hypothetical protein
LCHWAMADPAVVSPAIARSIAEINFFMARNIALACASRKANVLARPEPVDRSLTSLSSAVLQMKYLRNFQGASMKKRDLQGQGQAHFRQGRVAEGSGRPLQFESRRQRTPRDRHPRRRRSRLFCVQGAHSRSDCAQQRRQVEIFGESEILRDSGAFNDLVWMRTGSGPSFRRGTSKLADP